MYGICYNASMIVVYTLSRLNKSVRAKLQKRNRHGKFVKNKPTATVHSVEKNPLVTFMYPHNGETHTFPLERTVRLISSNSTHFTGLERQTNGKWKFKKYLKPKATRFTVAEFRPESMS